MTSSFIRPLLHPMRSEDSGNVYGAVFFIAIHEKAAVLSALLSLGALFSAIIWRLGSSLWSILLTFRFMVRSGCGRGRRWRHASLHVACVTVTNTYTAMRHEVRETGHAMPTRRWLRLYQRSSRIRRRRTRSVIINVYRICQFCQCIN